MDAHVPQRARLGRIDALSPVHEFALKAALWLPLGFVVWFSAARVVVVAARCALARNVLLGVVAGSFLGACAGRRLLDASGRVVAHAGYLLTLTTAVTVNVPASAGSAGGVGVLEPTLNPMVYAYSLPLFGGLAMATPLSTRRRLVEILDRVHRDLDRAGVRHRRREPEVRRVSMRGSRARRRSRMRASRRTRSRWPISSVI